MAPQEALLTTPRCPLHPHSAGTRGLRSLLRGPALHVTPDKASGLTQAPLRPLRDPSLTLNLRFHLPLTLFWLFSTHTLRSPSWSAGCRQCPSPSQPSNPKTDPEGGLTRALHGPSLQTSRGRRPSQVEGQVIGNRPCRLFASLPTTLASVPDPGFLKSTPQPLPQGLRDKL